MKNFNPSVQATSTTKLLRQIASLLALLIVTWFPAQLQAQAPSINSFSPATGPVGTLVAITGANLSVPTAFTVGGATAIVVSNNGSTVVGMVMPGTVTGAVSITTTGGTATGSGNFTVTATPFPLAQQGAKLVGTGNTGIAFQGSSVAVSADGNTAIIGGVYDDSNMGAAWVYTRSGGVWAQQGSKLVGTGGIGTTAQGQSVALSADGNTAIVGGPYDNSSAGAAWVYTRSGGVWMQQGAKLVSTDGIGAAEQGFSVGLSADGNTAIISGPDDNSGQGAAWVYTRSGSAWTQQGTKLVGIGNAGVAVQGQSVALSADGNTVIVGAPLDNSNQGAAWVYTRSGGAWAQQGAKLVGTGGTGGAQLGESVALSADGNTAIVGGFKDNVQQGAAWVYTRNGGTWTQQGAKLVGTGNIGAARQGESVALSADGNTAMVGGIFDNSSNGAAWVYTRNGNAWTQKGAKLVGTGNAGPALLGGSVSLSADGSTAMIGGHYDNGTQGAAWAFTLLVAPTMQATNVTITGTTTASASWTNGNGAARAVFMAAASGGSPAPVDLTGYNANTTFGTGDQIASTGWYCVYNGTGSTVNITGLTAGTTYQVMVVEYNGAGSNAAYLTTAGPGNPGSFTTAPLVAISSLSMAGNSPTNAASVNYKATFGSAINGLTASNFSITASGVTGAGVGAPTTADNGKTWTVPLSTGTGDGTVQLVLANATGILPGISTTLPFAGDTYTIDRTAPGLNIGSPSVASIASGSSGTVTYTLTYSDANFNTSNLSLADITLNTTGTASGTVGLSGSGTSYTVTIFGIIGKGRLSISVAAGKASDRAGNLELFGGGSFAFDVLSTDATLQNLSTSGGPLTPVFSPGTTTYTTTLNNNITSISIIASPNDRDATVKVNGTTLPQNNVSNPINLAVGPNTITIAIKAQDGVTAKTYILNVTRLSNNANLAGLALSSGTLSPVFATGTVNYSASVNNATASIKVTPTTSDTKATVKVNGTLTPSGTPSAGIPLNTGINNIYVVVLAQDSTRRTYTLTITRALSSNANLANLAISGGTLNPAFVSSTTGYTASVGNTTSSIKLTPITSDVNAKVQVNGITVTSGSASASLPLVVGINSIYAVVSAQDGTRRTYTVTVTRLSNNANLANLAISNGTLSPVFVSSTTGYTASVGGAISSVKVTPTTSDANAKVQVNGITVTSGSASAGVPLVAGVNSVHVVVYAQDSTRRTYTITITTALSSNANLANLTVSSGTLSPVFVSSITGYSDTVSNATSSIKLTPTTGDVNATVQVNGITVASGSASANVPLSAGVNSVHAVVHAQDGTQRTYTVTVTRLSNNANMANLTVSSGVLSPAFISSTVGYTDTVSNAVTSVQLSPTTSEAHATVSVNGVAVASGSASANISLAVGNNTIYGVVLAQDGTRRTYTITVRRLTPGGLNSLYLPGNGEQAPLTALLSEKVEASNILSPNGDGVNDIWVVKNLAFYPDNTVSVYNKAGQVVFTKKGYANDWDGTYRGSILSEGTYYYLVDLGNGSKIKGFITVVGH